MLASVSLCEMRLVACASIAHHAKNIFASVSLFTRRHSHFVICSLLLLNVVIMLLLFANQASDDAQAPVEAAIATGSSPSASSRRLSQPVVFSSSLNSVVTGHASVAGEVRGQVNKSVILSHSFVPHLQQFALAEFEVGGAVTLHAHRSMSELFHVLQGQLRIVLHHCEDESCAVEKDDSSAPVDTSRADNSVDSEILHTQPHSASASSTSKFKEYHLKQGDTVIAQSRVKHELYNASPTDKLRMIVVSITDE